MPLIKDTTDTTGIQLKDVGSDPAAPAAGLKKIYAKAGGVYIEDESSVVTGPLTSGITQTNADARYLQITNNLSEVTAATARTNIDAPKTDHDHSGTTEGDKLAQANTHESPDTDAAAGSLHHTIGASATQAAAGNHTHAGGTLEVKEADGAPDVSGVTLITVTNGTLTDNGGGSVTISTGGGTDAAAIHDNVASEISAITEKVTPVDADLLLIEDSEDSNNKKKIQISSLATPLSGNPSHAYFTQLAALLEPLAIEVPVEGTFTYAIAAGATKYLLLGWYLNLVNDGTTDRIEVRDPRNPLPLRNVTVYGSSNSNPKSTAAFLDPTLPTFTDAWGTYYDRLAAIATTATKHVRVSAASTAYKLLIPPYGIIVTQVTCFNFCWVALQAAFDHNTAFPLDNEIGDTGATDYIRFAHNMTLPLRKEITDAVLTGASGGTGTALGSLSYIICPSTWGKVTDPNTYDFRDDFLGASLDTASTWTRTQTAPGQVEIDTTWQWLKVIGDGTWAHNGIYSQGSIARANGKVFMCDVYTDPAFTLNTSGSFPNAVVGFSAGSGHNYTDFSHGIYFSNDGGTPPAAKIYIFENGNNRGVVGTGYTKGYIYRVRITVSLSSNNAAYAIQGGPEYGQLGSATWTDITPGTTSSSTTPLHAGVSMVESGGITLPFYVSDVKVY